MPRTRRIIDREGQFKWIQITKSGNKKPSQNKLRGGKTYEGYSHYDYQGWGQEGGRPLKWKNEAERKKWARQQKALREGKELRGYRTYEITNEHGNIIKTAGTTKQRQDRYKELNNNRPEARELKRTLEK